MDFQINVLIVYRKTCYNVLCNDENYMLYETKPTKLSKIRSPIFSSKMDKHF